jgi:glycerophosphoryl diester phosphodiesterase
MDEKFAVAVAPVARHFILSGGHPEAIGRLAAAAPGLPIGFDPCHEGAIERLRRDGNFPVFVDGALTAFPAAEMVYLDYRLVLFAGEREFDVVGAFHAAGKRIDAYTLKQTDPPTAGLAERLLAMKVDQITTDDPVGLERLLGG